MKYLINSRVNGESNEETNGTSSPSTHTRFSGFRPASARSLTTPSKTESDSFKPLWNGTNNENKTPFQNGKKINFIINYVRIFI